MDSKTYWEQREAANLAKQIKDEKAYEREIERIYKDMLDGAQKELEAFYGRYADKEGITIAEARKRVSKLDIEAYERKAKRYVKDKDFSKTANEEMRLYNLTMKVNRLEMLKANIGLELLKGHSELETFMGKILKGRTEAELKRQAGILGKTVRNNAKLAHSIVNASYKNATFSQRIWGYQGQMKADLGKMLEQGMLQGKNARVLAKELEKYCIGDKKKNGKKGARYNAERLMRTELARVQTEAQRQSFEANGFEMYTFIVNGGCCPLCEEAAKKNGGHYKVKDMQPGLNAPPLHSFCRCSIAAYEDSDEYEEWLNYLAQGGTTRTWNRQKGLKKSEKTGTINVEFDKFVPCLEDARTGDILDTMVSEITDRKALKTYNEKNGWYINWAEVPEDCRIFALKVKGSDEVQGLVAYKDMPDNLAILGHWAVAAPHNQKHLVGDNKKYNGVGGHLFAIMAEASVNAGYDGFMYGKAANKKLLDVYIKEFGAEPIGDLRFFINEENAHKLLDIYNYEWDEKDGK